ncbi:hypothetical protein A2422_01155 [Candidatus Woesebacteria bacterium RIFOXYC1_FULL_31_51]|uniref:Type IV pilus assembly protein PilM n=1 Tax=Candidatus Woesebacteria bacterium GW2011_GWC2_31_9 TaxID=1618586 RepID=A0A0G0BII3_9BACT|nr:MAG: type IV pilus assembly protein PilM, type IV pilus assembly protein PilM [Candidatus Woesebacteria bacterium GW2011_GWF1_31_35]KKP22706.1 MAG: Type IV pilus assembly protein PilM [Candidatus Woesebacteria bacterium GW2011_GWC1_30_29]KKP25911.1 MAG: Type IV pilus assembly protein PilM [Candidatus Woesebacteria bacterium GW2011_GWD1_31_12]KKP27138.1 MAG: Type IV pilus assembly protein PilM [Candidatus Woesebacteria bacterium GW2011_GWB1_31_29]KKP30857.1 MAG: Type IV pilus assembly protein
MVGIDIGSKSIKIVELVGSVGKFQLKSSGAVGYTGLSPDKMTEEKDFVALSLILKKIIKQIGITSKEVNIALPEPLVFTRVIKFPLLSDEEVNSAIKWEAEQYIPIPINEAIIQYSILSKNETTASTSVLLVAAPKVVVEKYVKIVRLAGLTPVSAETELTALARSISPEKGVSLLLDLGASSVDMAITRDSKVIFTRSIPVAGETFTRAVSQSLGINMQQAEEYKKTYGLSGTQLEGKVKIALEPIFKMVTDEIKKAIHFFQSEEKEEAPTTIIISGGSSLTPELVSYLTEVLGLETVSGNPFNKVAVDPETSKSLAPYISIYGTAVGLAMLEG